MNTAGVRRGDLVRIDLKGRLFIATVRGRDPETRRFAIEPLRPGVGYRSASSREIVEHWRERPLRDGRVSTTTIRSGDLVRLAPEGRRAFVATVLQKQRGRLRVRLLAPDDAVVTEQLRDTVRHYARRRRTSR
ncbi:hypothetical protein [Conexibacter sp. CPCC 206217]|uniref:hypothetical protein n=1 Tax=Conexibacter sp. CPCC 206217 TaxID=3064574 RepID=UPI002722B98B|nr:hypothetical protein [Conexibacter sp. CPCC 206217]MDO8208959.1 hypothetical protein [Conexibacter sp. CPCC 206217]